MIWQPCRRATSAKRLRQLAKDVVSRPGQKNLQQKVFALPSGSSITLGRLGKLNGRLGKLN